MLYDHPLLLNGAVAIAIIVFPVDDMNAFLIIRKRVGGNTFYYSCTVVGCGRCRCNRCKAIARNIGQVFDKSYWWILIFYNYPLRLNKLIARFIVVCPSNYMRAL